MELQLNGVREVFIGDCNSSAIFNSYSHIVNSMYHAVILI